MRISSSKKGFYIPALAFLAIVIFLIIVAMTMFPELMGTFKEGVGAVTGKP